jgi:hypothetical protein
MAAAAPSKPAEAKVKSVAVPKALPVTSTHKSQTHNQTHTISAANAAKEKKLEAEVNELKRQLAEASKIREEVDEAKAKIDEAKKEVKKEVEEAHAHNQTAAKKVANRTAAQEVIKKAAQAVKAAAEKVDHAVQESHKLVAKPEAVAAVNKSNTSIAKVAVEHVATVTNKTTRPLTKNGTAEVHHNVLTANTNGPVSMASFYATEDQKEASKTAWHWEPASTVHSVPNWIAPLSLFWRPPAHFVPPNFKEHKKVSLVSQNWHLRGGSSAAGTVASMEHTAAEAHEDMLRNSIAISDAFSDMEADDEASQKRVKHEDEAARQEALDTSASTARSDLTGEHQQQVHIGNVFTALEHQDDVIQHTMDVSGDNADYSQIKAVQDASMAALSSQLAHADKMPHMDRPLLKHSDKSFEAKAFHEAFAAMEHSDQEHVKAIKRNPDLQMLQVNTRTHH